MADETSNTAKPEAGNSAFSQTSSENVMIADFQSKFPSLFEMLKRFSDPTSDEGRTWYFLWYANENTAKIGGLWFTMQLIMGNNAYDAILLYKDGIVKGYTENVYNSNSDDWTWTAADEEDLNQTVINYFSQYIAPR